MVLNFTLLCFFCVLSFFYLFFYIVNNFLLGFNSLFFYFIVFLTKKHKLYSNTCHLICLVIYLDFLNVYTNEVS